MITMPFGKHRGKPIIELSSDYLAWLNDLPDLREPLASAVEAEVHRRRDLPQAAEPQSQDADDEPEEPWVPPTPGQAWQVTVRCEGDGPPGITRLKRFLKQALRQFGLRAVDLSEVKK